jgi:molybdopterin/thiamine biosynthesis adenylyltransferase
MLSEEQIERYSRQVILPQIGGRGQEKLLSASVAVLGAGAMGCTAALYLAAAGLGRLQIIDAEDVDTHDLAHGLLGTNTDLGRNRARAAAAVLGGLNPDCAVTPLPQPVTDVVADEAVRTHDVILCAAAVRDACLTVNTACLVHRKPLLWGDAGGFRGQFALLAGAQPSTPCYGCLQFSSSLGILHSDGVFGPTAAFIGTLHALVAIEIILGLDTRSRGRMVVYDALELSVHQMTITKDPCCQACGNARTGHAAAVET